MKTKIPKIEIKEVARALIDVLCEYERRDAYIQSESSKYTIEGLTNFRDKIILINDRMDYDERRRVLVHEVVHVYAKNLGIEKNNEKVVLGLEDKVMKLVYK